MIHPSSKGTNTWQTRRSNGPEFITEEFEEPRSTLYQFQPILSSRSWRCNNCNGASFFVFFWGGLVSCFVYVSMLFWGVKVPYNRDSETLFWMFLGESLRIVLQRWLGCTVGVPLICTFHWWDSGTPKIYIQRVFRLISIDKGQLQHCLLVKRMRIKMMFSFWETRVESIFTIPLQFFHYLWSTVPFPKISRFSWTWAAFCKWNVLALQ